MAHPRQLDTDLIDAYLARRALDYLFGFTLSPVLWRKLPGAKSAGRVQSVALRLIVDREREIEALRGAGILVGRRADAARRDRVRRAAGHVRRAEARAAEHRRRRHRRAGQGGGRGRALHASRKSRPSRSSATRRRRSPPRRCSRKPRASSAIRPATRCGWRRTLYEAGAITYMRTDGVQMDRSAISAARRAITERFDGHYLPEKPRIYQTKAKNAQEAHEAIRPTDFHRQHAGSGDEAKLYDLIFKRAMASQMASASLERTTRDPARSDRAARAARDRPGGQVPRLPRGLRGRPRPEGARTTRTKACCR